MTMTTNIGYRGRLFLHGDLFAYIFYMHTGRVYLWETVSGKSRGVKSSEKATANTVICEILDIDHFALENMIEHEVIEFLMSGSFDNKDETDLYT